jgi:hypothetical protein
MQTHNSVSGKKGDIFRADLSGKNSKKQARTLQAGEKYGMLHTCPKWTILPERIGVFSFIMFLCLLFTAKTLRRKEPFEEKNSSLRSSVMD